MNKQQLPVGHVDNAKVTEQQAEVLKSQRRANCPACNAKKNGVKSRITINHTCR